ncbi:MAG: hypothetical protein C0458_24125 [Methylobacterium sp.]|nr:hypothetical protein [Methylobacterium sp.]
MRFRHSSRCHPGRSEAEIRDPFLSLSGRASGMGPGSTLRSARDDTDCFGKEPAWYPADVLGAIN